MELSRATYQSTPLAVSEARPKVFSFVGAGGTVTAIGASRGCAIIETRYGPRVGEIGNAISSALEVGELSVRDDDSRQNPGTLINWLLARACPVILIMTKVPHWPTTVPRNTSRPQTRSWSRHVFSYEIRTYPM